MTGTAARRKAEGLLAEAKTRAAERNLGEFMRQAWPIVEHQQPLLWNWHIDAMAEHLTATLTGQIKTLVINVPPGTTKSSTVSVMFPAWVWAKHPDRRFLCTSHDQGLSSDSNVKMRDVVVSKWYQDRWEARLRDDQNAKMRFDTVQGGYRIGTTVGGGNVMGKHPHFKLIDDPHRVAKKGELSSVAMLSDKELDAVTHWYTQVLTPRGAGLGAVTIIVMQRLHERDLTGHVLSLVDSDAVHLCLPMRFEAGRKCATSIGWTDPREKDGELLWSAMYPETKLKSMETQLDSWGTAAQLQQRPAPKGGAMFKREWFKFVRVKPRKLLGIVRFWDVAGTEGGSGPQTVGLRMSLSAEEIFTIEAIKKGRWGERDVDKNMKQTAVLDGRAVPVREEQEPGSSGKKVIAARKRMMRGFDYDGVAPDADKVTRARPLKGQAEAGNVCIFVPEGDADAARLADEFLREAELFPFGALKDQIDAASGALAYLTGDDAADPSSLDDGAEYPLYY